MKTSLLKTTRFKHLAILTLLLYFIFAAILLKGQDGKNDVTFNTYDKAASQGTNGGVTISAIQSDNKIIISGNFTSYNGEPVNGMARLNMDGKLDKSFNSGTGTDGPIQTIALSYNKIILGGDFNAYNGIQAHKIVRLNSNGSIDKTFKVGAGADKSITKIIVQPDEKIVVAGTFTKFNDRDAKGIVRLNKNGSIDNTFNCALTDSLLKIHQLAILPNGKIIVSGLARNFFGDFRSFIVTLRLNNDGSRDYSFNECKLNFGDSYPVMNSIAVEEDGNLLLALANQDFGNIDPYNGILMRVNEHGEILKQQNTFWINSMIVQQNKKVMILGFDNPEWGIIKRKVIRMNPDLTVDSTFKLFDEKAYADPYECAVQCVSVQIDNKLVIGGNFYEINGLIANNIARLNPDGSFDYTFNQRRGCNGSILTIAKQANNCLLIGGEFSRYNYQFVSNIARLKKNGELDFSFFTGKGTNGKVYSIAVQADGKILIGGSFTSYNGNSCNNIARLNADGSFDPSFKDVKTDDIVRKIRIDEEGRILIGGDFNTVNNQPHIGVARVQTDGTLDESFHPFIDYTGCVYDCKIAYNGTIYLALNYKNTFDSWIDSKIERLHSDGTIDSTFKIPEALLSKINAIELTDDNHLFAAGMGYYAEPWFYPPSGIIVKLSEEGSRDSVFHYKQLQNFLNKEVRTISLLSDDKILIGGDFDANKTYMNHIGAVNNNGTINMDFAGNTNANVYSSIATCNSKAVIGGIFSTYSTNVRNGIARIMFDTNESLQNREPVSENARDSIQLIVYPNPAISAITVSNLKLNSKIKIYNAVGVELFSTVSTEEQIVLDLNTYSNGIYFVVSDDKTKPNCTKFIVSK